MQWSGSPSWNVQGADPVVPPRTAQIHELVPGMSDIAIWEYEKGDSAF